jgi:stearoyl-CoA desaturase (delta-9 desaturase)
MDNVLKFKPANSPKILWGVVFAIAAFHIFAIWALFSFSWANLIAVAVTWWISGSLGIGLGYHRLLTHRGYKTPKWMEYFLTLCASLAIQGGPVSWVTTHRIHHAFTETEDDPHSPIKGFFWAHMGWVFKGGSDLYDEATRKKYSPDIMKDKFHVFMEKYYWVTSIFAGIILFVIGGWSMVLWGLAFRVVWGWHSVWIVNSITHIWGSRRFETRDTSTNNALVAILAWGEGWHNNHHAYPRSARHGMAWYEFDFNWSQIWLLEKVGLAKNVFAINLSDEKAELKAIKNEVKAIKTAA